MWDGGKPEVLIVRRWTVRLAVLVTLFLVISGGWLLYTLGGVYADHDLNSLRAERDQLRERVQQLEAQNAELERRFAVVKRARQIDQEAYAEYRKSQAILEHRITELREEVAFYRGIMAPEREIEGIHAQSFTLTPGLVDDQYHFRLVMVQMGNNNQVIQGQIRIEVTGTEDGKAASYGHGSLSLDPEADNDIKYRYRYFQVIEGDWALPEGFEAREVVVRADPKSKGKVQSWTFPWTETRTAATEEAGNAGE